jgi:hypothetical protein
MAQQGGYADGWTLRVRHLQTSLVPSFSCSQTLSMPAHLPVKQAYMPFAPEVPFEFFATSDIFTNMNTR